MGTEVLRPQYLLAERFRVSPPSFFHRRNGQYKYLNRQNQAVVPNKIPQQQLVTNPNSFPRYDDFKIVSKHTQNKRNQNNEFSMAKVTILRRGESMDFLNEKIKNRICPADMVPYGLQRLGPQMPELIPDTMYAGSAFSASPSPSDLPLPTFFKKHQSFDESFDDSATRDLRRLLRIE